MIKDVIIDYRAIGSMNGQLAHGRIVEMVHDRDIVDCEERALASDVFENAKLQDLAEEIEEHY